MTRIYTADQVYNKLIDWIKEKVPTYRFDQYNLKFIKRGFDEGESTYKKDEANEIILSFTNKIKNKDVNGHLTSVEKNIFLCDDKQMHPYKHTVDMGKGEFWTDIIMNWNFSRSKGVDLDDENLLGVDIKALTTSTTAKIPCTFYSKDGIPIKKKFINNKKCIFYDNELYWREGDSFKGMYRAMDLINFCRIDYPNLNRYIYYKFDLTTDMLTSVVKDKEAVEDEINFQLRNKFNDKLIDLTHSKYEDGAYIFTYQEFSNI